MADIKDACPCSRFSMVVGTDEVRIVASSRETTLCPYIKELLERLGFSNYQVMGVNTPRPTWRFTKR